MSAIRQFAAAYDTGDAITEGEGTSRGTLPCALAQTLTCEGVLRRDLQRLAAGGLPDLEDAEVGNTVKAFFRQDDPAAQTRPAPTSTITRDGGWFGGAARAPDAPLSSPVLTERDFTDLTGALTPNGFGGPTSYYRVGGQLVHARHRGMLCRVTWAQHLGDRRPRPPGRLRYPGQHGRGLPTAVTDAAGVMPAAAGQRLDVPSPSYLPCLRGALCSHSSEGEGRLESTAEPKKRDFASTAQPREHP